MSLALRPAETSTRAIWCDGVFKRYKGVLRLEVNVLRQAGPRNVCMRSVQPCLPSPKRRVDSSIIAAKVRALLVRTGEAFGVYPSGALPGGFLRDALIGCALTYYRTVPRHHRSLC